MDVSKERFLKIKEHFEKEAAVFDKFFFKVMPHYEEMTQGLANALPFTKNEKLKIIDLGCGTGNLSRKIIKAYPNAQITCIDMAENMLKMAKVKLGANSNVKFWLGDVRNFDYAKKYDAIVASMVLHHVEGKEKPKLYHKIYNSLIKGGSFFNIDIFVSANSHLQKMYMDKWKTFMKANGLAVHKTNDMIKRHEREDRPVVFKDEIAIMHQVGFKNIDIVLKYYNFALYGAIK